MIHGIKMCIEHGHTSKAGHSILSMRAD